MKKPLPTLHNRMPGQVEWRASPSKSCSTCAHWDPTPTKRYPHRGECLASLPFWADNRLAGSDEYVTSAGDGADCKTWQPRTI